VASARGRSPAGASRAGDHGRGSARAPPVRLGRNATGSARQGSAVTNLTTPEPGTRQLGKRLGRTCKPILETHGPGRSYVPLRPV